MTAPCPELTTLDYLTAVVTHRGDAHPVLEQRGVHPNVVARKAQRCVARGLTARVHHGDDPASLGLTDAGRAWLVARLEEANRPKGETRGNRHPA